MAGRVFLSLVAGLLCIQPAYAAGVFHVNAASTAPIPDGRSWDTAFRGIQSGVDAASADGGGEVWVAGGTYTDLTTPVLTMKWGVGLYGGFGGGETARDQRNWVSHPTLIDGENARQCVLGTNDATLDGFTVTRGIGFQGGGMSNMQCSPAVANCLFAGNNTQAACNGGGLYNSLASPVLTNCTFAGNVAETGGGAAFNSSSSPVFTNCVFTRNRAGYGGGAVYSVSGSVPLLVNCVFTENTAILDGGGGICSGSNSSPALMNCTFVGNSASFGGAVYSRTASVSLTNCLLWGDTAQSGPEIHLTDGSAAVTYSCVQGGAVGKGNIKTDPLFVDGGRGGSLQIRAGSPCIDTGTVTNAPKTDLIGRARPQGSGIDMGAYERGQGPDDMVTLTVQVSPPDGGRTIPAEGVHYYVRGETAWLMTLPLAMTFANWSGAVSGTARSVSIAMDTDKMVTANFEPNILYVNRANATGPWDGRSWATAFADIQSCVNAAFKDGCGEVWVAQGTYTATIRPVLTMMPNVSVYGGFAGGETAREKRDWTRHITSIDGQNLRQCVAGADESILDGFTIMRGAATNGGGLYNNVASPILRNCVFVNNRASSDGGGAYNHGASPVFTNCTFTANSGFASGGGVYNLGGSPAFTNCAFTANTASSSGGGNGGAMYNSGCSPVVTNCTFNGNNANVGGGIYNYTASPRLTNCILWGDKAPVGPEVYSQNGGVPAVTYSCVQGGASGAGNIVTDPLFVDAGNGGSVQLLEGSPCIDTGTTAGAPLTDLLGRSRPQGAGTDMGAYEGGRIEADVVTLSLQISPPDGGRTTPAAGTHYYVRGETASSSVVPLGMCFTGWSGSVSATEERINIIMDAGKTVTAGFRRNILYVNGMNLSGQCDGRSWVTAFRDIQSGIEAAAAGGGEVWVAAGTYTNNAAAVLTMKQCVSVYGGFQGTESTREQRDWTRTTTIDGQDARRCVIGANDSTLDGFTITRGQGSPDGGGMCNYYASPAVANCIFSENTASDGGAMLNDFYSSPALKDSTFRNNTSYFGGGVYNRRYSSPSLTDCTFVGNTTNRDGAGMCNSESSPILTRCSFTQNATGTDFGYEGGGMWNSYSSPVLTDCTFSGNTAALGGGMANSYAFPVLTGCRFSKNTAQNAGGMSNENSSPVLTKCTFSGNKASYNGGSNGNSGGMKNDLSSSPRLANCVFIQNTAHFGGGMGVGYYCSPVMTNCTFSGNTAAFGGAMANTGSSPTLTNCILWGDTAPSGPEIYSDSSTVTVAYSCLQGGFTGTGNIDAAPLFVQVSSGNVQLMPSSPCIDAGTSRGAPTTDLVGNYRPQGNGFDMGACESPYVGAVAVPNLSGRTQKYATALLAAQALSVGAVSQEYSISVPAGSVIAQAPAAGTLVPPRSMVNLTISLGPRPFTVSYTAAPVGTGSLTGPVSISDTVGTAILTVGTPPGYTLTSLTASNGSVSTQAPYVLSKVTGDTTVTATFTPNNNSVTYTAAPPTGGTVTGPAAILTGDTATLDVSASPGYTLLSVTVSNGGITPTAPFVLSNVTANTRVTATFTANSHTVAYAGSPPAGGTATGAPTILTGSISTVTVTPRPGYSIASVTASNGNITTTAPYVLSDVMENTTVTAVFTANENTVTCAASPTAGGAVAGPPTIPTGGTVIITVTPNDGYSIAGVTSSNGSITATAPYVLSNVTGDTTVTATFSANSNAVNYVASPTAGGTVTGPPIILTGDTATVTVTPQEEYSIVSVAVSNGGITATAPYILSNVTTDTTVTATFGSNRKTLTYAASPPAGGSVTGPPTLLIGDTATVTVTPQPGYHIDTVAVTNGSITASAPYILSNLTADTTVTAVFSPNSNSVTYAAIPPEGGSVAGPPAILTGESATVTVTPQAGYDLAGVTASNGSIMATAPYVLSNVTASTTVTATFAPKQQLVSVPDVSGQTQASAASTITGAGLVVGSVTQVHSATVPAGGVIAQDPLAGVLVSSGNAVNLIVSQGPEPAEGEGEPVELVSVPYVSGMSAGQAEATLTGAGLTVSAVEEGSASVPAGQVIRQEPTAGAQVAAGTQVSLVVSSGPEDSGCGCAGCSGGKGAFTFDNLKKVFGDLFLGGLSLMALLALSGRKR